MSVGFVVYWNIASFNTSGVGFLETYTVYAGAVDDPIVNGCSKRDIFGTNAQRKAWMDFIKVKTGSELKP